MEYSWWLVFLCINIKQHHDSIGFNTDSWLKWKMYLDFEAELFFAHLFQTNIVWYMYLLHPNNAYWLSHLFFHDSQIIHHNSIRLLNRWETIWKHPDPKFMFGG